MVSAYGLPGEMARVLTRCTGWVAAAAAVLGAALGETPGHAAAMSVTADPASQLVGGQFVTVSFAGFAPSDFVRIRQCPRSATDVTQCKQDSQSGREAGDSRFVPTGNDGSGGASFVVAAGKLIDMAGGTFFCDAAHDCELDVLAQDSNYRDLGLGSAGRAPITFGASTIPCQAPSAPSGKGKKRGSKQGGASDRVAGSGASQAAADIVEWQSETCTDPYNLNLSYAVTNSPNGKQSFLQGLSDSDFAVSGIPLTPDEVQALKGGGREAVEIPIVAGSLSIVYNYWAVLDQCRGGPPRRITGLRLSPQTAIWILTGRISNMADPHIAADNPDLVAQVRTPDCQPGTTLPSKRIVPVGRADNSAATWVLSSWADAVARDAWQKLPDGSPAGPGFQTGPTTIFPAGNGVDLRTGNAALAFDVRTAAGSTIDNPEAAWFGYADSSVARLYALPTAAIRNASGSYVSPTTQSVQAGLAAGTLNPDGTLTPNYAPSDPNAYPLATVSYLITDKSRLTLAKAQALKSFAAYAVTKGQDASVERGYVPLPDELRKVAAAQIEAIGAQSSSSGGGGGRGGGRGHGLPSGAPPQGGALAEAGSPSGSATETDRLKGLTGALLAAALHGRDALSSTPSSGPLAVAPIDQVLGPAGGPGGIVRAVSVVMSAPMLAALGTLLVLAGWSPRLLSWLRYVARRP